MSNIEIYEYLMPQEWFIAPLDMIDKTFEMIINGEMIKYKYDKKLDLIVVKD